MPRLTVSVTTSWKVVYRWPCSYSNVYEFITTSLLTAWTSTPDRVRLVPHKLQPGTVHTLPLFLPAVGRTATNKVHEAARRQESAAAPCLQPLRGTSESYWRDTWRRLGSGPSPGRCCCGACASYRSSGTACTLSPETVKMREVSQKVAGHWTFQYSPVGHSVIFHPQEV